MKRNSRSRRASAGAPTRQDAPVIRLGLLLPAVLVCVAAGGIASWQLWMRDPTPAVEPLPAWEDSFPGEAFSREATAQQINEEAERVTQDLLEAFPRSAAALNVLARWEYVSGDAKEAAELWQQCLELDPNLHEALYALGSVAMDGEEYERASELFGRLRLLGSSDPRVPVLLAEALLKSGRDDEARDLLEQHVRTQATSAEAMVTLGQLYLQSREYEKAIERLELARRAVPEMREAHYALGQAYARSGQTEKARQAMEKFRALAQERLQHESRKAKGFLDHQTARTAVAQVHDDAAKVYRDHARFSQAEQLWRKAVFLDPQNTDYWRDLLSLFEQTRQHREALQASRQLVKLEPENVDYWLNVGVLSAHAQRPEEALAAVERALELDRDNPRCQEAHELVKQVR